MGNTERALAMGDLHSEFLAARAYAEALHDQAMLLGYNVGVKSHEAATSSIPRTSTRPCSNNCRPQTFS